MLLAGLDEKAFVQPQPKDLKSKIPCGASNSNLEFVEEFFAVEEGENNSHDPDGHIIEHSDVYDDDFNDGKKVYFLVKISKFAPWNIG